MQATSVVIFVKFFERHKGLIKTPECFWENPV